MLIIPKKKFILKMYTIKPYETILMHNVIKNISSNYIYIKTESEQLYFKWEERLIKIYNKMIKNIFVNDYIINKSNKNANILIYILLKNLWFPLYIMPHLYISRKQIDEYISNKIIQNIDAKMNSLYIYYSNIVGFYDILYIETITEINDYIEIKTKLFTFYYYPFKICKNYYELRIKKIFSEEYNININLNITINLDTFDKNYKILKKFILNVYKLKIKILVDMNELLKIYGITKLYSLSTIFINNNDNL